VQGLSVQSRNTEREAATAKVDRIGPRVARLAAVALGPLKFGWNVRNKKKTDLSWRRT